MDPSRLHYRWASEGEVDTLGRRDRVVIDEQGPTLSMYELDEAQLNGVVRGMAFGRNGRVPGRVLVAARRFKLKEGKFKLLKSPDPKDRELAGITSDYRLQS